MPPTDDRTRETRVAWVPREPLPDGWRWLSNQTLEPNGSYWRTMTNAPIGETWFDHDHRNVKFDQVVEERFVTPWEATTDD